MIDKRYFRYFDWISFSLTIILLSIGLLFVFSSTYKENIHFSIYFKKQIFGILSGIVIYFFFCAKNLRSLYRWGYFCYFIVLGLLLYTTIGGWIGMGAKRWISLYFITFQPSELVKLLLPPFIAFYFDEQTPLPNHLNSYQTFKKFLFPLFILGTSFFLILKQPDLGTALIILFSGLILLWIAGIPKSFFIISSFMILLGAPILWKSLQSYQQQRILVLLGYGDSKNERYQIEQSKIAIGSGGMWGKGLLKGTQNRLAFLPESRTDFIFSVLCEEWGFVRTLLVLLLFSFLFIRLIYIILQIPNFLEQLIGIGVLCPIVLSTCINVGMVTGILPTVGIPLPLFTYGITQQWITLASLGILNNLAIRRFYYY